MNSDTPEEGTSFVELEGKLWIAVKPTGIPAYDYEFERTFACRHAWRIEQEIVAVARMGAAQDYAVRYCELLAIGIRLVHSPEEYARTSYLPNWYPLIHDLTPKSVWFEQLPSIEEVEVHFRWPVFIKGERQTNRHSRKQCIIESSAHLTQVMSEWKQHPILAWQRVVCREYLPLRQIGAPSGDTLPKSFEFRTFWWRNECVGVGHYWVSETYKPTDTELAAIQQIAGGAARRLNVTFLVVDVAQTQSGDWIVIEVNDGQDSGYAGVNPMLMWRNILEHQHRTT